MKTTGALVYICIYIYTYTYIHTYIYIYIYIYIVLFIGWFWIDIHKSSPTKPSPANTVGFHNFNLRIFNLRVSNPNKLIVDVFLTRCRISICQGLGPKKHYEISEIDRIYIYIYVYIYIYIPCIYYIYI